MPDELREWVWNGIEGEWVTRLVDRYVDIHYDVATRFIAAAVEHGAHISNPDEIPGAFRVALDYAFRVSLDQGLPL